MKQGPALFSEPLCSRGSLLGRKGFTNKELILKNGEGVLGELLSGEMFIMFLHLPVAFN